MCSAAVPLTEKMHTLNKLHSDTGYSSVGCRFSINEPTMVYIQKKKKGNCPFACEAALQSAKVK